MMVGNILPGDEVTVELVYSELIVPTDGSYEFVYPTVVGPRYTGTHDSEDDGPRGWTEQPTLHEGEEAFHTTGIEVALHSGIPLAEVHSPSHEIEVEFDGRARSADVHVAEAADQGDRDFVLRYRLAGDAIQSGLMLYPGEDEGFFLLMVEPPERVAAEQVVPREYVFILDVSGSMNGFPLEVSRSVMRTLLPTLRPVDRFNVMLFAGGNQVLAEGGSLPATEENVGAAMAWIDGIQGSGGTELLPAMERAVALPRPEGMSRILVVATDGYVTVERQTFDLIRENLGDANLFSFGIGSGVNRFLIEGMAHAGRGEPFVALDADEGEETAERFVDYVSSPVLQGVDVEFAGLDAYDVEPEALPDLFAARPVIVWGKYRGRPRGQITVRGHVAGGEFEAEVDLADAVVSEDAEALRYLWARERVRQLSDLDGLDSQELHKEDVTQLGLDYHLLTEYTSFVAVDRRVRADEIPMTVDQPLPLPAGVSDLAVPSQHATLGGGSCSGGGSGQMGLGGLGTKGYGSGGGGSGYGYGSGGGYFGAKGSGSVGAVSGSPIILGAIDRSSIERVIKRHLNQIRYCYTRELQKDPDLAGKISVKFVIAADGTVASAEVDTSTLANPVLERCIVSRFQRMKFPAPAGGGVVIVRYPFVFSVAEES
jgi:Ca-activated chloride channel family protein